MPLYNPPAVAVRTFTDAYSTSGPSSPNPGDHWRPSNGGGIDAVYASGVWAWYYKGYPITLPDNTAFSWNNQRSATVDATKGPIYLHTPIDSADSWPMRLKTLPATPYSLVCYLEPILANVNFTGAGIALRKASTGDWIAFVQYSNGGTYRHTVGTGGSGNFITAATYELNAAAKLWNWLAVTDDGTTRYYYYGDDGQHWEELYHHGHTAITTPDTYGIAIESRNSVASAGVRLVSLAEYNSVII